MIVGLSQLSKKTRKNEKNSYYILYLYLEHTYDIKYEQCIYKQDVYRTWLENNTTGVL